MSVVRFGGTSYIWADEAAALVVAAAIIWAAVALFRKSASELMDAQANHQLVQRIRETAESAPDVRAVETLWVKSGLEYFVDIHIQVDPHLTVAEGHLIGHRIKADLLEKFSALRDVLVHLEPFPA